jgi:CRP/FNR family transcriptional regulator, cyclic AMP receptor protein
MPAPIELLQRVRLFQGLERNELETLSRSFKDRTFSAGQTVAKEGSGGIGFFVIESGEASVSIGGEEKSTLGTGDYFGEIALIDEDSLRTATITADTDLKCWGITSWEFRPLVETHASIAWSLLKTMAHRLREAEQRAG